MSARIEPIVGQYLHLDYEGRHYRIYFESAGQRHPAGVPAYRRGGRAAVSRTDECGRR